VQMVAGGFLKNKNCFVPNSNWFMRLGNLCCSTDLPKISRKYFSQKKTIFNVCFKLSHTQRLGTKNVVETFVSWYFIFRNEAFLCALLFRYEISV